LKLDAFEPERKRLKQLIDEQFKALRALDADKEENAGASKNGIKLLIEQRETINAEINELIGKRRELFAENKRQNDVWYSYQREEKARKAEQYRLEKIQREKQKKLDSVKQARELAEMPAFETEINTCNALISVLRLLQRDSTGAAMKENNGSIVKAESVNSSSVDPNMALPKGVTATVALKKKSDRLEDEQYLFLGSKKKGSHKSSANPNKGLLKFDIAVVEQFLSLDLTMPAKHVDIADAVAALNAKKEFFFQNQERVTKENIQKAKELEEKVMKSITENEELNAAEPMGV
jgi:hypothetical protein